MVLNQQLTRYMYGPQTSAYATVGTRTTVLGRVQSFTPINKNGLMHDVGLGEGFNVAQSYFGPYDCGGSVVFNPTDFDFLKHWIGPKSGAGTAGDPYTLTEDDVVGLTSSDIQVFSFEVANSTEGTPDVTTYVGCVGDTFDLSGAIGSKLNCNATFIARHPDNTSTTPTAYSADTGNAFLMLGGTWSWGATPTALTGVQSFNLRYSSNLIGPSNRDIDSRFIVQPVLGGRSYNFSLVIKMTSTLAASIRNDFYGASGTPATGGATANPTADLEFKVALLTGSKNALFWLDQCSVDDISVPHQLNGGLALLTINGTAKSGRTNTPIKWWTA